MFKENALDLIDLTWYQRLFFEIGDKGALETAYWWVIALVSFIIFYIISNTLFGEETEDEEFLISGSTVTIRGMLIVGAVALIFYYVVPIFLNKEVVEEKLNNAGKKVLVAKGGERTSISRNKTTNELINDSFKPESKKYNGIVPELEKRFETEQSVAIAMALSEAYSEGSKETFKNKKKSDKYQKFVFNKLCPKGHFKKTGKVCDSQLIKLSQNTISHANKWFFSSLSLNEEAFIKLNSNQECAAAQLYYNKKKKSKANKIAKEFNCIKLYNEYN